MHGQHVRGSQWQRWHGCHGTRPVAGTCKASLQTASVQTTASRILQARTLLLEEEEEEDEDEDEEEVVEPGGGLAGVYAHGPGRFTAGLYLNNEQSKAMGGKASRRNMNLGTYSTMQRKRATCARPSSRSAPLRAIESLCIPFGGSPCFSRACCRHSTLGETWM